MKKLTKFLMVVLLLQASSVWADDDVINTQQEIEALKTRIAELEAKQSDQAIRQRNAELLRSMIAEWAEKTPSVAQGSSVAAGYDGGFFIKTVDDQLLLKINGMMQFRHTYGITDDRGNDLNNEGLFVGSPAGVDSSFNAFELTRPRLKLSGHVMKDVQYFIQYEFSDDNGDFGRLLDFKVSYSFMPELGIQLGRGKVAFGREYNISASKLMFVDRSLANAVFNTGRSNGVELFGTCPLADTSLHYRLGVYNGFRDITSTPFAENDNNPAVAARFVVPFMGAEPADFANESDLAKHPNPVAQLGVNFAYANALTEDHMAGGTDDNYVVLAKGGDGLSNGVELGGEASLVGVDFAYKYNGMSVLLDGYYQHADLDSGEAAFEHDFGSARDAFGIEGLEMDNYGFTAQAGYFLSEDFEFIGRFSGICVDNTNDSYEYAAGWNWYLNGQNLKLSMDVSYIDDLQITSSSANYDGVQNNALFLIRTQLQFVF